MRTYLILVLVFSGLGCLPALIRTELDATTTSVPEGNDAKAPHRITVRAASPNDPVVNIGNGVELSTVYPGDDDVQQLFKQGLAQPRSLESADFDEDGVPDLIVGYRQARGGSLALYRGNLDSIYQNSPESQRSKSGSEFDHAAFLSQVRLSELAEAPDFLVAGDFDADGHWDVVTAARASKSIYLLTGDGHGNLAAIRQLGLPGTVTGLVSGEINRADGLADLIVGVLTERGPQVMIFEGPDGALTSKPESFSLPDPAKALRLGRLDDDYLMALAVAAGRELMIIYGRDRQLSLDEQRQAEVSPATITHRTFAFDISDIAIGNFTGSQQTSLAMLATDGTAYVASGELIKNWDYKATKKGEDRTTDAQVIGQWRGASQLLTARVSVGPADDLLMLDKTFHQLRILTGRKSDAAGAVATLTLRPTAALLTEGEPVGVLPMRLNADALSDLVVIQTGLVAPTVVKTVAAMVFTVNKADDHDDGSCDSGDCTLREAINAANANPGADSITFSIPGLGVHTISPTSPVPTITDAVTIDGTTQPGFAGTPVIELRGTGSFQVTSLNIAAGNSTVRGLAINSFFGAGVNLSPGEGNRVEGNFIGLEPNGTPGRANMGSGIFVMDSSNNVIGGTTPAARNVISGNNGHGISLFAPSLDPLNTSGNQIQGNLIGTSVSGTAAIGNAIAGVFIDAPGNTVGGTMAGARNILSGNDDWGIDIQGITNGDNRAAGNLVQGNYMGTDVNGTVGLGNESTGISIFGQPGNTVGGTVVTARNIISGNALGVQIDSTSSFGDATGVLVEGNYIGTDVSGIKALPNSRYGIILAAPSAFIVSNVISGNGDSGIRLFSTGSVIQGNIIGATATGDHALGNAGRGIDVINSQECSIGGESPANGNTIVFNASQGVLVRSGISNAIRHNAIFSNGGLGIDLGTEGVTASDLCDGDTGANNLQNFPVLTSATFNGITTTLQGTLNSTPNATFQLEFFANNACDPSGFGEGQTFIGSTIVTTGPNCNISFNVTFPAIVQASHVITATATDSAGNTSEFSQCAPLINTPFDLCLQDDSNARVLLVNLTTGNYLFSNCRGFTLTGASTITTRGCLVNLQVNGPDRRMLVKINTCLKKGTASVQSFSQGATFTILDKNIANNSCACPAG